MGVILLKLAFTIGLDDGTKVELFVGVAAYPFRAA